MMKLPLLIILLGIWLGSCQSNKKTDEPVAIEGYQLYLDPIYGQKAIDKLDAQLGFWEKKYSDDPRGFIYLEKSAGLLAEKFRIDGQIEHIYQSDSLFDLVLQMTHGDNRVVAFQGLSKNSVLKHEFGQARVYADSALRYNSAVEASMLLKLDATMELGDQEWVNQTARTYLQSDAFDNLTRRSKYVDGTGDLDSAILIAELALAKMENAGNKKMMAWSMANLGDMYMHAGRVQDSFQKYMDVLEIMPHYVHALKGIAWLLYSDQNRNDDALDIVNFLKDGYSLPDFLMMEANIYEASGNDPESVRLTKRFIEAASAPKYGRMYSTHVAVAHIKLKNYDEAVDILNTELNHRSTPELYGVLAWAKSHRGDASGAVEMIQEKIIGRTEEPATMYYTGKILFSSGEFKEKGIKLLAAAAESSIELGPVVMSDIKRMLN